MAGNEKIKIHRMPNLERKSAGRPTLNESLAQREKVLAVALEEFLEQGFDSASLEAIAQKTGINRVTIYRQYGSKEGLFRAAMESRAAFIESDLRAATGQNKAPEEVLLEIIERIYEDFIRPEILAIIRLSVTVAPRLPDVCATLWERESRTVLAPVAEYLHRLKSEGVLDLGDPELAAYHLANMAVGGMQFLLLKPLTDRKARRRWAQSVLRMVLPGLQTSKPDKQPRKRPSATRNRS